MRTEKKPQQKPVCFQLTWHVWKKFKQIRKQSCPAKVLVFIFLRTHFREHRSDQEFAKISPGHWTDKNLEPVFQITDLIIILDGSSRWLTRPRCWTEPRDQWFDQDLWPSLRSRIRTWSDQDLELICDAIDLRENLDGWKAIKMKIFSSKEEIISCVDVSFWQALRTL